MMELVTLWLRQVIAAAFFSAAVAALIPAGAIKRIAMLGCSLLLLMTLFRPLAGRNGLQRIDGMLRDIETEIQSAAADYEEENREAWAALIEQELVSYIETRAKAAGLSCEVSVTLEETTEGIPLPASVELMGAERNEKLHRALQEELGLTEEQIRWRSG